MLFFGKVVSGLFMVAGVAQSFYFFDIPEAIKKQFEETEKTKTEKFIEELKEKATTVNNIKNNIFVINNKSKEIDTQNKEVNQLWNKLNSSYWSTPKQPTIEELNKAIDDDKQNVLELETQSKTAEKNIEEAEKEIKKMTDQANDPNTWTFTKIGINAKILINNADLLIKQQNMNSLKKQKTDLEITVKAKEEILNKKQTLKTTEEETLMLIEQLNESEDSLE